MSTVSEQPAQNVVFNIANNCYDEANIEVNAYR